MKLVFLRYNCNTVWLIDYLFSNYKGVLRCKQQPVEPEKELRKGYF